MRAPEHLETARLKLRPVELTDAADIFAYAGEEAPTRFMNFPRHSSLVESEAFAKRCVDCWESSSAFPWAIIAKGSNQLMGVIELRVAPPKADFGYILNESYWGQGFATESASAVVGWAIAQGPIFRVWATCHPRNIGSAPVLRKVGLSFEATLANWEERPQLGEKAGSSACYAMTKPLA